MWPQGSFGGEIPAPPPLIGSSPRIPFSDTRDAHAAGIAMIHQELSVFPELTVAEHLELDAASRLDPLGDDLYDRVRRSSSIRTSSLGLRAETPRGRSIGGRAPARRDRPRALYRNAGILVFDEPTSALTEQEV